MTTLKQRQRDKQPRVYSQKNRGSETRRARGRTSILQVGVALEIASAHFAVIATGEKRKRDKREAEYERKNI